LVVLAACQNDRAEPFGTGSLPELQPAQQRVLVGARGQEGLVSSIPGFGGLFLDDDGVATVYVTNPMAVEGVDDEVLSYLGQHGIDAPPEVRVRRGDFTLLQLDEWFEATSPEVLELESAVFVDLDEAANRLTIGVEDAGTADRARRIAIDRGVPEEAVSVFLTDPILPMNSLRDAHSPTVGGLQINFPGYLCTLGFNAEAEGDGGGGGGGGGKGKGNKNSPTATVQAIESSFITNSHCTTKQGGVEDTPYWQPLQSVNPVQIATEVEDPDYKRNLPGCPKGRKCRLSDASRARYDNGTSFTLGAIAIPGAGPNTGSVAWSGATFTITAEGTATVGQTVNKVGRTTGWTQGTVTATNVATGVSGTNIVQLGQTFVQDAGGAQVVAGGDSGSQVFMGTGGNVTLVGLLWGGNGAGTLFVYSPIANVEAELGNLRTHSGDSTVP
jgi:hypothetical protein